MRELLSIPLAVLAVIVIFMIIYYYRCQILLKYGDEKGQTIETVIFIKNAQDEIEGIVNNFYSRQIKPAELLIVDCGSMDQTPHILQRLAKRYIGLKLLFLSDLPFQGCAQEVLKHTRGPVLLLVDGTCLNYNQVLKIMDLVSKNNVGIGLKSYEK